MSLNNQLPELHAPDKIRFEIPKSALDRWSPDLRAEKESDTTIGIYEPIGKTFDGAGFTAGKMAGILRNIGNKDVQVNINSPGGSLFDGVAIYNLLRTHKAKVTVNVVGVAASAASIIAMAGDERLMGEASRLMIHNSNVLAMGNRKTLMEAVKLLEPIDKSMAELYAMHTGLPTDYIQNMMDAETWINATDAISQRFATGKMKEATVKAEINADEVKAHTAIEQALQILGYSRGERRELLKNSGKPCATEDVTLRADIQSLISAMKA